MSVLVAVADSRRGVPAMAVRVSDLVAVADPPHGSAAVAVRLSDSAAARAAARAVRWCGRRPARFDRVSSDG
ncbi:hypothetical protein GCM10027184_33340 [Saccharothrix stipae]